MIELWRGAVNTWECDEMGHLNVRHYIGKAWEGLGALGHALGLARPFGPDHGGTFRPTRQHVRFIREVRPGQPVFIRGGVVDLHETGLTVHQEMVHSQSGDLAASVRTRLEHVDRATATPFPLSAKARARAEALIVTPDARALPRSLEPDAPVLPDDEISLSRANALKVGAIGRGTFRPDEVASAGVVRPASFMGRISDSVPNLMAGWRSDVARLAGGLEAGAAVLEIRLAYRRWPEAGDLWQLHSALGDASAKTHRLVHWMLDPVSGKPWITGEAVAVTFDLKSRKIIPASEDMIAALEAHVPKGLKI